MKTRFKWLLILIVVLGGAGTALWYGLNAFATDEARRFLAARDIPVERLTITSLTTKQIVLSDVAIGEGSAVKAQKVTITRLSGTDVNTMQLRVEGSGIDIRAKNTRNGWSFGGVERLFPRNERSASAKQITEASLHLSGVTLDAQGSLAGDIAGTLNASNFIYKNENDLLELNKLTMKPALNAQRGSVAVPFSVGSASFSGKDGMVFTPLALTGTMNYALASNQLKGNFSGRDGTKRFAMNGTIDHNLVSGTGVVKIKTNDIALGESADRLKLSQLLPTMDTSKPTPSMRGQLTSTITLGKDGYESVDGMLEVFSLESGALLSDALSGHGTLDGLLKAKLPFTITPKGWMIKNGDVINDGPMKLEMIKQKEAQVISGIAGLLGKNVPNGALDAVNISSLNLQAMSTDDQGEMVLKGKLQGNNPMLKRDVIININLSTNLMDMLKSLSAAQLQQR